MNYENMSEEDLVESQKEMTKKSIVIKVSPKRAVQINGIRRFPVTYYKNEWEIILGMADEIRQFITDHESELAVKGE